MLGKVLAVLSLLAFALLSAIIYTTTPATIHPVGILIVFVFIYVLALGVLTFFIVGASWLLSRLPSRRGKVQRSRRAIVKGAYLYASVLALAPVMILGMRSIGQTGVYETFLVVIFEIVACFYIAKQR